MGVGAMGMGPLQAQPMYRVGLRIDKIRGAGISRMPTLRSCCAWDGESEVRVSATKATAICGFVAYSLFQLQVSNPNLSVQRMPVARQNQRCTY